MLPKAKSDRIVRSGGMRFQGLDWKQAVTKLAELSTSSGDRAVGGKALNRSRKKKTVKNRSIYTWTTFFVGKFS